MAKLAFQIADVGADSRLGEAKFLGRRGKAAEPGRRFKAAKPQQIGQVRHVFIDKKYR